METRKLLMTFLRICSTTGVFLFAAYVAVGCAASSYNGKLIDQQTKLPIEGAAIVAVWWQESGVLVPHPIESVFAIEEILTDIDGNFSFVETFKRPLNPTVNIKEPRFTIFKPGYRSYADAPLKTKVGPIQTGLYEKDGRIVVELKSTLTRQDKIDSQGRISISDCYANNKCPNLIRLINIERANLGLQLFVKPNAK